jgi:hypothetical protein
MHTANSQNSGHATKAQTFAFLAVPLHDHAGGRYSYHAMQEQQASL